MKHYKNLIYISSNRDHLFEADPSEQVLPERKQCHVTIRCILGNLGLCLELDDVGENNSPAPSLLNLSDPERTIVRVMAEIKRKGMI
jgi:hypothetical protein